MLFFSVTSASPSHYIPKFLETPTNVTVHRGELAELMCHIRNLGPRTVILKGVTFLLNNQTKVYS